MWSQVSDHGISRVSGGIGIGPQNSGFCTVNELIRLPKSGASSFAYLNLIETMLSSHYHQR
jgi:hypothetical protein